MLTTGRTENDVVIGEYALEYRSHYATLDAYTIINKVKSAENKL